MSRLQRLRPATASRETEKDGTYGDNRAKGFVEKYGDDFAELDAVPPDELRSRIETAINEHIDQDEWARLQRVEEPERETLSNFIDQMPEVKSIFTFRYRRRIGTKKPDGCTAGQDGIGQEQGTQECSERQGSGCRVHPAWLGTCPDSLPHQAPRY